MELDSLYYLREKRDNLSLLRRDSTACLVDDNGTLLAELVTLSVPVWIGTHWFMERPNGLMRIDLEEIFRRRYRPMDGAPDQWMSQWIRKP